MLVWMIGLIQQVAVGIPVMVIIEKGGLGRIAGKVKSVRLCRIGECSIPVVDIKHVGAFQAMSLGDSTNIDVIVTVPVYICHRNPGTPVGSTGDPGLFSNVFKNEMTFIQI